MPGEPLPGFGFDAYVPFPIPYPFNSCPPDKKNVTASAVKCQRPIGGNL